MKNLLDFDSFVNEQFKPVVRPLANKVLQELKPLIKPLIKRFNLERTTQKKPLIKKLPPKVVPVSDKLQMVTRTTQDGKPLHGVVSTIELIANKEQHIDLKIGKDELGEFYFMSAIMDNPIDAGKAFKELIKLIPKGSRFKEGTYGSLSTDSFYSVLRRCKDSEFSPKVVGEMAMNSSGKNRFQDLASKGFNNSQRLGFKDKNDALSLVDALNKELQKVLPNSKVKTLQDDQGIWEIFIPKIQLIKN